MSTRVSFLPGRTSSAPSLRAAGPSTRRDGYAGGHRANALESGHSESGCGIRCYRGVSSGDGLGDRRTLARRCDGGTLRLQQSSIGIRTGLLAAYPEKQIDLSERELAVATIYGDRDGLATVQEIEASFSRLPAHARTILIAGGNHAQFGWYGPQAGDLAARISRHEQQDQVLAAVMRVIRETGL